MVSSKDVEIFREDAHLRGTKLTPAEREKLLKPYLPEPQKDVKTHAKATAKAGLKPKPKPKSKSKSKSKSKPKKQPIRTFLKSQIHRLIYVFIHLCLGFYIRISQTIAAVTDRILAITYYHHRSPELIAKDVKALSRLPEHLSVLLKLRKTEEDALQCLMDETAELAAWTTCAGIPVLSVYEKTGILKSYIPALHKAVSDKLSLYYGSPSHQPQLRIFAPHHSAYYSPYPSDAKKGGRRKQTLPSDANPKRSSFLTILLLSHSDGRETLVDLTKTLTEMAQNGKLSPNDISANLIDAEISDLTSHPASSSSSSSPPSSVSVSASSSPLIQSADNNNKNNNNQPKDKKHPDSTSQHPLFPSIKPEPDLLIIFGPYAKLDGYPPWQIRLTEIYCTGDKTSSIAAGNDDEGVEYQGFLKGLWRYARASFRFGR